MNDFIALRDKVDALEIILTAPVWPKRNDLSESGKALFDAIVDRAKEYALGITACRADVAVEIAGQWGTLLNAFMDDTRVVGHEASERLCAVAMHYLRQLGDLNKIERASS